MSNVEKQRVEKIVVEWARAVSAGDRKAILAHHAHDLLMFDFPDTVEGIGAYGNTRDFFFANPKRPVTYEPTDLRVVGLEKRDGKWLIIHEHHSVPTIEESSLDSKTFPACL